MTGPTGTRMRLRAADALGLAGAFPKSWLNLCAASALSLALPACGSVTTVMGLPKAEFDRVFVAAIDVSSAEHCGADVDAGLIRSNLIAAQTQRGLPPGQVESSGLAFDKTRNEYKRRISSQASFCSTDYKPELSHIAAYEKGAFPDVP